MSLMMPETEPVIEERLPIDDSGSLSEHEATYQPKRGAEPAPVREPVAPVEPAAPVVDAPATNGETAAALEESRDPMGRFKPKEKHRAASQKARPEDVPRIKELTRKLREAEEKLAAATAPTAAQPVAMPASAAPPVPQAAASPTGKFTFPTFDDYVVKNPQASWDDWNDAKNEARIDWRDSQRAVAEHGRQAQWQAEQQRQTVMAGLQTKVAEFTKTHPDYQQVLQSMGTDQVDPELLIEAVIPHDKAPELLYYLGQHPWVYHEMRLIAEGKPNTPAHVASLRRILEARMSAGTTAAATPIVQQRQPPKPPTAVRTGPLKTGTEPPGEGASLAEHEAYYSRKRR